MYCTIADIRDYDSDITIAAYPDQTVSDAITLSGRIIDREAGQWFESRTMTFALTGNGINELYLPVPAISITSVTVDDEELDSDYYKIKSTPDGVPRFLKHLTSVWKRDSEIAIDGNFGKVESDQGTPPEAKRLCMILAVALLKKETNQTAFKSERFKDMSYTKADNEELLWGSVEARRLLDMIKAPPSMGVF